MFTLLVLDSLASPAMPYAFNRRRDCKVLDGYGVYALVPCDHLALPFCEITIDWAGLTDNHYRYRDQFHSWDPRLISEAPDPEPLPPFHVTEPIIHSINEEKVTMGTRSPMEENPFAGEGPELEAEDDYSESDW
ncbi:hypothetical protein FBUS_01752 [Fasciolopsis buskii]|uniref:Uncharacterized protein n=1 Tax=Fasciolopsis buskii TaxID=27845 RepID=A0A8E0VPT0_9TREM|nr:hypothetical protein FBUS_01752 [Fasciolopsis buski]